jgi:hypothetical protein
MVIRFSTLTGGYAACCKATDFRDGEVRKVRGERIIKRPLRIDL